MSAKAISMPRGKGSLSHNNREFTYKNVNPDRTKFNRTYASQPLGEAYEQCFGESVKRYNEKQTRADRKIKGSYYEHLFNKPPQNFVATATTGQKSFYEQLVQIGTKDDTGVKSRDGHVAKKCLDKYMQGFSERNPNFHVFNAVMHLDEATPHLHIDYIPIGHYKRGMDVQNGMAQALKEMGYGGGEHAINRWRLAEREVLVGICRDHGIEISEPKEGRGFSLTTDEYKEQKDAEIAEGEAVLQYLQEVAHDFRNSIETLEHERDALTATVNEKRQEERESRQSASAAQKGVQVAEARLKAVERDLEPLERRKKQAETEIAERENSKTRLDGEIAALVTKKETLTNAEIEAVKGIKTITGGVKLSAKEYEQLKTTAVKANDGLHFWRDRALSAESAAKDHLKTAAHWKSALQKVLIFFKTAVPDAFQKLQDKIAELVAPPAADAPPPPREYRSMDEYHKEIAEHRAQQPADERSAPAKPSSDKERG